MRHHIVQSNIILNIHIHINSVDKIFSHATKYEYEYKYNYTIPTLCALIRIRICIVKSSDILRINMATPTSNIMA